jgi:hypothetical protein
VRVEVICHVIPSQNASRDRHEKADHYLGNKEFGKYFGYRTTGYHASGPTVPPAGARTHSSVHTRTRLLENLENQVKKVIVLFGDVCQKS